MNRRNLLAGVVALPLLMLPFEAPAEAEEPARDLPEIVWEWNASEGCFDIAVHGSSPDGRATIYHPIFTREEGYFDAIDRIVRDYFKADGYYCNGHHWPVA